MADRYKPERQDETLASGVPIYGQRPDRGDRPQLLLLYANTNTERRVLNEYIRHALADVPEANHPLIAWFNDANDRDDLEHEGLVAGLQSSSSLDITPIGLVWKPKSDEHQSWWAIRGWMKLVDSNRRQRSVLKRTPGRCAVVIGEFGTQSALKSKFARLHEGLPNSDSSDTLALANYISLQAALTIERDARAASGQTIKYPRFVIRSIWGRPAFQQQLAEIAKETGTPLEDIKSEARDCLKELVPKVRAPHVSLSTQFAKRVSRLGYDEDLVYDKGRMKAARDIALSRPTALVWTHKTHIDGLAIMLASRTESFPLVHTIGGNNMAFLGVGYLMKRAGTIFIRRSIDSQVYKLVLRSYIAYLLEKRFPLSWALEGTRSRNGKLMPPRFGILKYVVEAAARDDMQDLTIIPVSIYYDLIAELGDYATEQAGKKKRKESLAWFADYIRSLRKPLGRISLGIGDPVVVDTTTQAFIAAQEAGDEQFSIELQKLAFDASVKANDVTPITPSSLISLVLTGAAPQALTEEELATELWSFRNWAEARGLPMTEELADPDRERVRNLATAMIEIGVVSRYDGGTDNVYRIADGKHFEASYYRNNAIHFFVEKAIIEVALAKAANSPAARAIDAFWDEALRLRDTFKYEFFYPDTETYRQEISDELERVEPGWKAEIAAGNASDLLGKMDMLVSHAVLRPFTEAYGIVAGIIEEAAPTQTLTEDEVVSTALKIGKQAYLQRKISSEESIGKLMFANGFKLAENRGLTSTETGDLSAARSNFVVELNDLAQCLRVIGERDAKRRQASVSAAERDEDGRIKLSVVGKN